MVGWVSSTQMVDTNPGRLQILKLAPLQPMTQGTSRSLPFGRKKGDGAENMMLFWWFREAMIILNQKLQA